MSRLPKEAPIYPATHDLLDWLVPHLEGWPRPQRFLLARQVLDSATGFYRLILRARKVNGQRRADTLLEADTELETLKALLRLGQERRYMSLGQYQHVSRMMVNVGRQLGGWRRSTKDRLGPPPPGGGAGGEEQCSPPTTIEAEP
jgi:hypothetical protein